MPTAEDVEIALYALETTGLLPMTRRTVQSLSGGEFQLLLVARALAQQADLLLLDEPTSHLDLGNKKRLVTCLQNLVAGGTTILFTSHEPEVVAALADQVVLMRGGQVLSSGALEDIWQADRLSEVYGIPVQVHRFDGHRYLTWV
ncbi:ABC transporter ATP-binding protein [Bellilinea caldifistulae]|uniref:AAA family ATPase n=1 Tax=Bellilinea caldifistulae TaxID=360411 RepID=UPI0009E588A1|nr:ABC transporter ATP-binding protein [Bellilinea caldifistulae]